jgi:hypothetical protein
MEHTPDIVLGEEIHTVAYQTPPKESNPSIFDSYIREAKVFDDSLVARWKVAMDGLILFVRSLCIMFRTLKHIISAGRAILRRRYGVYH